MIFLNTVIANTFNLRFDSCFKLQVYEFYRMIDWTNVWYSSTFVDLLISSAIHILLRFLTMPDAKPILRVTSFSEVRSWEMTPPRYTKSSHCTSWVLPNMIFICRFSRPIHCTSVFALLTFKPNLLLVVWILSTNCCRSSVLPTARQMSSAKRRSEMYIPEMLAPIAFPSILRVLSLLQAEYIYILYFVFYSLFLILVQLTQLSLVVYGSTVSAPCCLVVLFHSKCFYVILSYFTALCEWNK